MSEFAELDVMALVEQAMLARVEYHESIGSTQDRAHELAAGDSATPLPLLVVAEQQTAGRGRGANRWWTGTGSLAFSLVFDPVFWGLPHTLLPARSLAAAVAVVDLVTELLPDELVDRTSVGFHWPNDVFVGGRKIAGILIDVLPDGRHILGIGLNVNNSLAEAPADVQVRATSLIDVTCMEYDRTYVLIRLLALVEQSLRDSALEPEYLAERFNDLCLQRGRPLMVESGTQCISGRCSGIATDGALLLDTDDGPRKIYSGVLR